MTMFFTDAISFVEEINISIIGPNYNPSMSKRAKLEEVTRNMGATAEVDIQREHPRTTTITLKRI